MPRRVPGAVIPAVAVSHSASNKGRGGTDAWMAATQEKRAHGHRAATGQRASGPTSKSDMWQLVAPPPAGACACAMRTRTQSGIADMVCHFKL